MSMQNWSGKSKKVMSEWKSGGKKVARFVSRLLYLEHAAVGAATDALQQLVVVVGVPRADARGWHAARAAAAVRHGTLSRNNVVNWRSDRSRFDYSSQLRHGTR